MTRNEQDLFTQATWIAERRIRTARSEQSYAFREAVLRAFRALFGHEVPNPLDGTRAGQARSDVRQA